MSIFSRNSLMKQRASRAAGVVLLTLSGAVLAAVWPILSFQFDENTAVHSGKIVGLPTNPTPPALAISHNVGIWEISPRYVAVRDFMEEVVELTGVDEHLLQAVLVTESNFHSQSKSHKGAIGLLQVTPDSARMFGLRDDAYGSVEQKLHDPRTNLIVGARILRELTLRFPYRYDLAVAAYNAGPGAVAKYGNKVPPYKETQRYVERVSNTYALLKARYATQTRTLIAFGNSPVALEASTSALEP